MITNIPFYSRSACRGTGLPAEGMGGPAESRDTGFTS